MSSYRVDRRKWAKMSINEQMGNISSEVGRSVKAWETGDMERFNAALDRALDLFNASSEVLVAQKSPRLREVLRARDQYLALFFDDSFRDAPKLENYFMRYALTARKNR